MTVRVRVPRRELRRVYEMALEMSGEIGYHDHDDVTGADLGICEDVARDLEVVRRFLKIPKEPSPTFVTKARKG